MCVFEAVERYVGQTTNGSVVALCLLRVTARIIRIASIVVMALALPALSGHIAQDAHLLDWACSRGLSLPHTLILLAAGLAMFGASRAISNRYEI